MKASPSNAAKAVLVCTLTLLLITVHAAPMDLEEEQVDNSLSTHPDNIGEMPGSWDSINADALRKLLMQIGEDRMTRATRSWTPAEPRGWALRNIDGRLVRQWRADKRQVRFRQCYFNPISCFRK